MAMTTEAADSTLGVSLKAKFSKPSIKGAPEDKLRAPLEIAGCEDRVSASPTSSAMRNRTCSAPSPHRPPSSAATRTGFAEGSEPSWLRRAPPKRSPGIAGELALYRTIVPQMVLWLPEGEAAQWRLDFETELERFAA